MKPWRPNSSRAEWLLIALALAYPLLPWFEAGLYRLTKIPVGEQLTYIYIYSILALGLNVVVGFTGLLHLGIAAFFGIGAYIAGILTVPSYPFEVGFCVSLVAATAGAALMGILLGVPTLRLRGDYLAVVTLGFGEVVRFALKNLEEITAGTRALNPLPTPAVPVWPPAWRGQYQLFYYLALVLLLLVVALLRNLQRSRLGRAWIAMREDELAAACMGINAARAKLSAFALGSGLAGLAGCLYATTLKSTAGPDAFDFNRSIMVLCCIILGGLGSIRGTLLGVFLLVGFDTVLSPMVDSLLADQLARLGGGNVSETWRMLLTFSNWRLMIFGLALILMMRLRPDGLLPSRNVQMRPVSGTPLPSMPSAGG